MSRELEAGDGNAWRGCGGWLASGRRRWRRGRWRWAGGRTAMYSHASRLVAAGWAERAAETHGAGSLIYATRAGVAMTGVHRGTLATAPAPTTWAHCEACAWTAAWLTVRGRTMVGPRELLASDEWLAEVQWIERHGVAASWASPDLIGGAGAGRAAAADRGRAGRANRPTAAGDPRHCTRRGSRPARARAVIYICATDKLAERVTREARGVGLSAEHTTLRR